MLLLRLATDSAVQITSMGYKLANKTKIALAMLSYGLGFEYSVQLADLNKVAFWSILLTDRQTELRSTEDSTFHHLTA
jgi:hypothetical protein